MEADGKIAAGVSEEDLGVPHTGTREHQGAVAGLAEEWRTEIGQEIEVHPREMTEVARVINGSLPKHQADQMTC